MVFSLPILRQHTQETIADLPALKDAAAQIAAQVLNGNHGQKRAGGFEKFWQFREYTEADRPQDIDWRQSAKTEHVYVREKELQTPQSIFVWAKYDRGMDFGADDALHTKAEAAQILSYALAMLYMRGGERVGVLGQKSGHSENALNSIGRALLEKERRDILPEGHVPSRCTLILASDFLEPIDEIKASFSDLSNRQTRGIVIQTLSPAERDLSFDGHVVFDDTAHHKHKVDNVASIRQAYQEKISEHILAVQDLCTSIGWDYYLHVTDTKLHDTLLEIWEGAQR